MSSVLSGAESSSGSSGTSSRARSNASSSSSSLISGESKGSRRRCGSANSAATLMSESLIVVRPSQAAWAAAPRAMTRSARMPSTSKDAQMDAIRPKITSVSSTSVTRSLAATMRVAMSLSASAHCSRNSSGFSSKANRRRITSVRDFVSRGAETSTARPNRSKSCGRNSPSSGFIVPTRTKSVSSV